MKYITEVCNILLEVKERDCGKITYHNLKIQPLIVKDELYQPILSKFKYL